MLNAICCLIFTVSRFCLSATVTFLSHLPAHDGNARWKNKSFCVVGTEYPFSLFSAF